VSGFVAAAIAAIPPGFQYATAKLEEAKSAAQLYADLQTKEADRNRKQEEFRQEYIKLFLDMAVDQDIELRLRFAEYFAAVSAEPFKGGWIDYRTRLEDERKSVRESIDGLERERIAALLDPSKKQDDVDQIERKLSWYYKEVGYLPLMRSVTSYPRIPELAPSKTALSEPLTGSKVPSASDTVKGLFDALLNTMNNARAQGQGGRIAEVEPIIRKNFDTQWMARLSSGQFWTTLSETQRQQLIESYGHYISALYADRFQGYSGQKLEVTGEEQRSGDQVMVHSQIIKANGEPVKVDYMCRRTTDSWLISDIYLDSAISEVASRRSEVITLLKSSGIDGLIAALNRKANALSGTMASK
jgi:phospholipid transport system substrate-binding protein